MPKAIKKDNDKLTKKIVGQYIKKPKAQKTRVSPQGLKKNIRKTPGY